MLLKLLRCIFGYVWAAALLLVGGWLLQHSHLLAGHSGLMHSLGVLACAGGVFVFMVIVADELFPRTPLEVRSFLKLTVGIVWCLALLRCGWLGAGLLL